MDKTSKQPDTIRTIRLALGSPLKEFAGVTQLSQSGYRLKERGERRWLLLEALRLMAYLKETYDADVSDPYTLFGLDAS